MRDRAGVPAWPTDPDSELVPRDDRGETGGADLAAGERAVLARWDRDGVPRRSLTRPTGGPRWTCYRAPLAAGGMPGLHHLPALVVTDLYLRLKAMQGYAVTLRGGWNCHGLAVEVAVERELGLSGPRDIEAYGVARFVARCRESASRHADAIGALVTRLGCWPGAASEEYRTMDTPCIESVWRSLKRAFDSGLLVRERRAGPYCPRCQTPLPAGDLSRPDVGKPLAVPAVVVRFPMATLRQATDPRLRGADLLIRTSTPWTLPANAAIAVHPHETYALARRVGRDERVVVAESRVPHILGADWHVATRIKGADLAGATYWPLPAATTTGAPRPVIAGYFVSADDGTGLAHVAPAFEPDSVAASLPPELAGPDPINADGRFAGHLPLIGGTFFTDASPILAGFLADRGLLFSSDQRTGIHPHCWRCGTPLLVRSRSAWHIQTTAIAAELHAAADHVRWEPPGRAAGGAEPPHEADWTISRTRYWGTPLPVWECSRGHLTCAGSLAELSDLAGRDLAGLDPHRPCIDAVTITCPRCGTQARRVPEVLDSWYDAGAMFAPGRGAATSGWQIAGDPPETLVAETSDRAAQWFSALTTVGVLTGDARPVGTAVRLGDVLDERGRLMTSGLGNLAEPAPLIDRYGADAVRWLCATAPPGAATMFSAAALDTVVATVLAPYREAAAILAQATAGDAGGDIRRERDGPRTVPPPATRPDADRWILRELHSLVTEVTGDLAAYDSASAGRRIAGFLRALDERYLTANRRRFWRDPDAADALAAVATLHECLDVLTRMMAPITPFLTDRVWALIYSESPDPEDSVHLASWPVPDPRWAPGSG